VNFLRLRRGFVRTFDGKELPETKKCSGAANGSIIPTEQFDVGRVL